MIEKFDAALIKIIGITRARRAGRFLVGFIPTVGTIAFIIHCATLLMGYDLHIAAFLFKYALLWYLLLTVLSIAFEFCWVHRGFCLYNYIIGVLIEHHRLIGFGAAVVPLRWLFLSVGMVLMFVFFRRNCWRDFFEHTRHYK